MATPKNTRTAGPADKGLKVVSAIEGFRRGGRAFGREPVVVPLADITPEQAEAIQTEPRLAVVLVDLAAA